MTTTPDSNRPRATTSDCHCLLNCKNQAALVDWAGLNADDYVVRVHQNEAANPLAMISTYLRSDRNLTPEAAAALEKVVRATYEALRQS